MEKADILEMTVSYLQSRSISKSPVLSEVRLATQLSAPYLPHSPPRHRIQTTGLSLLPGTTTRSSMTQHTNEDNARHAVQFADSTPSTLIYATPTLLHSPTGSQCFSDESSRSTPTGTSSANGSPPGTANQLPGGPSFAWRPW